MAQTRSKPLSESSKLSKVILQSQATNNLLKEISKKLDTLIVIELARSGLSLVEVSEILGVSEDTIERMLPFRKLKPKSGKE